MSGWCINGCEDVEFGLVCTRSPGAVAGPSDSPAMCAPELGCVDAVVHRSAEHSQWHTAIGTTPEQWFAAWVPVKHDERGTE